MMMEMEQLEPRVRPLPFKVKASSREASPSQKAAYVLDPDLRSHWSAGTNNKEWILLELDEACLLSHLRIYNKSVLEWEITVGLRYKPEAFVKVRPRCEAPRRDMIYPMNYTPCRYVRISCLRGNPISIFFIQPIGVSVPCLEPDFQPVVNYLLPHITSHKQDADDMHLQLLQDVTSRLLAFLPQLEMDLTSFTESAESNMRFLAMLAGPLYPILQIVNERESSRNLLGSLDSDASRNSQSSYLTVSSNFEAQSRRSRSPLPSNQTACSSIAFRPEAVFVLLKKAYKDSHLGNVCRMASRALQKLVEPTQSAEELRPIIDFASSSIADEMANVEAPSRVCLADYSSLFGDEFIIPGDQWDDAYTNLVDITSVEEGIFHVLYACAAQPLLCCKLADSNTDFLCLLSLVQAMLPALRPLVSGPPDQVNDDFLQWKHPLVQHALSQIVTVASSSVYSPLLRACAGYLSSYSPPQVKAACVLIDLCSGPLAPWISTVTAKVDLAVELLEDLFGTIQGARQSISRSHAALNYIVLALSGNMDDILPQYKEAKHKLLFLLEMLEPYLEPATNAMKNAIAFGDIFTMFLEKQEQACAIALNVIRIAAQKPAVLPSLESEWRCGSVAPSVLLFVLGPNMLLPPEIDLCKCTSFKVNELESSRASSSVLGQGLFSKSGSPDESDGKIDSFETSMKVDMLEDANLLFAPPELKSTMLKPLSNLVEKGSPDKNSSNSSHGDTEGEHVAMNISAEQFKNGVILDIDSTIDFFNLQADYLHLVNHGDCDQKASEFQRLALDLLSQHEVTPECHDAAIDALLLAAECYVNPFFMATSTMMSKLKNYKNQQGNGVIELRRFCPKNVHDLETIAYLERKRDKSVLEILLKAAELDRDYWKSRPQDKKYAYDIENNGECIKISSIDLLSADSVTLVRQNQVLLCQFIMRQLQKDQHSLHEILLQSLLFLLQSATEMSCHPEDVIDVILRSAEHLNIMLRSFSHQHKDGPMQLNLEKLHGVQRRWVLLQELVTASSGSDNETYSIARNCFQYRTLVPPSSWIQKIHRFSVCPYPLTRFLGWMAISRLAKQYLKKQLFLTSDISQLTFLLCIFSDELACPDNINKKVEALKLEQSEVRRNTPVDKEFETCYLSDGRHPSILLCPDLYKFFPNLRKRFATFGEIILEAVALQLRSLPSSAVPDVLCWFSDLCLAAFCGPDKDHHILGNSDLLRGYATTKVKAIILYVLEAIISEHMEAMVPEMPRVAQILVSLCRTSCCDVDFLESVLSLLKPLISYALGKVADEEKLLTDESSCHDFESLCFEELFHSIRCKKESHDIAGENACHVSLVIFTLGALFPHLSILKKKQTLESLSFWADFTSSEPTPSFYDYLRAFQSVMDSCNILLVGSLEGFGIHIPFQNPQFKAKVNTIADDSLGFVPSALDNDVICSFLTVVVQEIEGASGKPNYLSIVEAEEISTALEGLISMLNPAIEACWRLHFKLALKLTVASTNCLIFLRCMTSIRQSVANFGDRERDISLSSTGDLFAKHWRNALEGLSETILTIQENHCWQVASAMLDHLFGLVHVPLDSWTAHICSLIKNVSFHAPRISWRLQTDKWLSFLFMRGIDNINGYETPLVDLFCGMLDHPEPEQRSVALKHLGRLAGLDVNDGIPKLSYLVQSSSISDSGGSVWKSVLSILVSSTWDRVAALATSEHSMLLRAHAMALLLGYIPFAPRSQLQSFLISADNILPGLGKCAYPMSEGPFIQLSLCLLSNACLHSPAEDIYLVSESFWQSLESIGTSRGLGDIEKKICHTLCKFRIECDDAKEVLKELLSSSSVLKYSDPGFKSTRESILQVLSSLSSVQSYFEFFSKKYEQEAQEVEEAEIELELLQKERALQEISKSQEKIQPCPIKFDHPKESNRLQQIKDEIQALERSKLREEIAARRQKKLLVRHNRQKYLEAASLRESELLQELDRERTSEVEHEIERQRMLEVERAKTRELRYNLEMERERQAQRELQKELEQAESGVRTSRREFSSNPSNRPRERYRERESGRSGHEGSLRPSSRGSDSGAIQSANRSPSKGPSLPAMALSGSRSFSGQPPTILQSRDRLEERGGTGYEDNFEGSRDSGDASSVGDPDLGSSFDGGFGSAARQGSRGSRSRQMAERREHDGRREGKWERKHS